MLAGEALGAAPIGDLRPAAARWGGPWGVGVRPEQGARARPDARTERVDQDRGSKRA